MKKLISKTFILYFFVYVLLHASQFVIRFTMLTVMIT